MVKLLARTVFRHRVTLLEVGGAAAVVAGVAAQWGAPAGWIAGGIAGLVKAFELDVFADEPGGDGG